MKKIQDNNYSYDGSVLLRARKRLKIRLEAASKELTLSISQIQSIEENLSYGYATPYFRKLAIKRYAEFLHVSIYKVIFYQEEAQVDLESIKPNSVSSVKNILYQESNLVIFVLVFLSAVLFFSYSYFSNAVPKNIEPTIEEIDAAVISNLESSPMVVSIPEEITNTDSLIAENIIDTPNQPIINTDENFICTIQSPPVTSFTTKWTISTSVLATTLYFRRWK